LNIVSKRVLIVTRDWGSTAGFNLELVACIKEYCGTENVVHSVIGNSDNVYSFVLKQLHMYNFDFLIIDSRVCVIDAKMPHLFNHLKEMRMLNELCKKNNTIPICIVTDPLLPGFAIMADLLTYKSGLVVPITASIPFSRFLGRKSTPALGTPLSIKTFNSVKRYSSNEPKPFDLYLGGSLYEPRKSYFEKTLSILKSEKIEIHFSPKQTNSYKDYLNDLSSSKMVLTTNFLQKPGSKKLHLLGRSLETLYVGSLLFAQSTPDLVRTFTEFEDFIPVDDPVDAAEKILFYQKNFEKAAQIAGNGHRKAAAWVNSQYFFDEVDKALTSSGLHALIKAG
jgi:hypothetical protein